MEYVLLGACGLVGVVFLVSATSKLRSRLAFTEFVASLRQYGLLPRAWLRPVGLAVALAEAAIPALLAAPMAVAPSSEAARLATGAGFVLAGALLVGFTLAILLALRRGASASCRCFGASETPLGLRHVVRNVLLLAIAAAGVAAAVAASAGSAHPGGAVIAVLTGLVAGVFVTAFDDLVDLFATSPGPRRTGRERRDAARS
jgi:hypothetical protein